MESATASLRADTPKNLPAQVHAPLPIHLPEEPRIKARGRLILQVLDSRPLASGLLGVHPGNEFRPFLLNVTESLICTVLAIDGWELLSKTVMLTRKPAESDT